MIRKADRIELLEQYRDPGDEAFVQIALCDEEKRRLDVCRSTIPCTSSRPTPLTPIRSGLSSLAPGGLEKIGNHLAELPR